MEWFIADLHLNHANIIKYDSRPFADLEEMRATLLDNINRAVVADDTLFVLGDVALGKDPHHTAKEFFDEVVCKNRVLIFGNHDEKLRKDDYWKNIFCDAYEILNTKIRHQRITMHHFAQRTWLRQHHGAWCLSAHSHGSLYEALPRAISGGLLLDVGCNVHGYKPLSFEDIQAIMNWKREQIEFQYAPDHHTRNTP